MAIGIPLTRTDLADLTNLDIFDNVTGEISGYKLLTVLLNMQASTVNLLTDGFLTGNPGAPINPDYIALLQAIQSKAEQQYVVTELGKKEPRFAGLAAADLDTDKADYANLLLYPLLVKIVNALGTVSTGPTPATPTNLRSTASTSSTLTLAWNAVAGTYTLQRAPVDNQGNIGTYAPIYTGTAKTYQDGGLTYVTTYAYRVRVTVNGVDSNYSLVAQATTAGQNAQPLTTPAQPTAGAVTATTIPLTTPVNANATGYRFQLATNAGFTQGLATSPAQTAGQSATTVGYTFSGLSASTTYYGRVMLVGDGTTYTDSQYSAARQVSTLATGGGTGNQYVDNGYVDSGYVN